MKKMKNQKSGHNHHNSYSKTRKLFKRLNMRPTHPWMMASDLKYHMRVASFPVKTKDTLWTAYLRLKRVHRRHLECCVPRDPETEAFAQSLMESIEKTDVMEIVKGGKEND
jgi:hypothetical protein